MINCIHSVNIYFSITQCVTATQFLYFELYLVKNNMWETLIKIILFVTIPLNCFSIIL